MIEVVQMYGRQSRRDISGTVRPANPNEPEPTDQSKPSRYDILLASIPIVMLGAATVGHLAPVPLWASLSLGALASVPMVVDGVALNPPT